MCHSDKLFQQPKKQCTALALKCFSGSPGKKKKKKVTVVAEYSSEPKLLGFMSLKKYLKVL